MRTLPSRASSVARSPHCGFVISWPCTASSSQYAGTRNATTNLRLEGVKPFVLQNLREPSQPRISNTDCIAICSLGIAFILRCGTVWFQIVSSSLSSNFHSPLTPPTGLYQGVPRRVLTPPSARRPKGGSRRRPQRVCMSSLCSCELISALLCLRTHEVIVEFFHVIIQCLVINDIGIFHDVILKVFTHYLFSILAN